METKLLKRNPFGRSGQAPGKRCRSWTYVQASFLFLLLTMTVVQPGYGYSSGKYEAMIRSNVTIDMTKLNDYGYIIIKVPVYYNPTGAFTYDEALTKSNTDTPAIYINDKKALEFYFTTTNTSINWDHESTTLYCQPFPNVATSEIIQSTGNWKKIEGLTYYNTAPSGSNGIRFAEFRVYPTGEMLNPSGNNLPTNIKVEVGLVYTYSTRKESANFFSTDQETPFRIPTVNFQAGYSDDPYKYEVTFQGKANDRFTDDTEAGGGKKDTTDIAVNGTVTKEYDTQSQPQLKELTYLSRLSNYQYIPIKYPFCVTGYQKAIEIDHEIVDGLLTLRWKVDKIEPKDGEVLETGGDFQVKRMRKDDEANAKLVATVPYKIESPFYSITDLVSEQNLNGDYIYRISRTIPEKWSEKGFQDKNITLSMTHKEITSAEATINKDTVSITWEYNEGYIFSKGSKVILTRIRKQDGQKVDRELTNEEIEKKSCKDKLPTTCDVYYYQIAVKPGSTAYTAQNPVEVSSEKELFTLEMGTITTVNASKGYFSDHVEVEWKTDGKPIKSFLIYSRIYESNPHSVKQDFKQIQQIDGGLFNTYQYSDTKSRPGVIYEYMIVGTTECGGNTKKTESPYFIGFRNPTGDIYGRVTFENGQAVKDVEVRAEIAEGAGITGKSYHFNGEQALTVNNKKLLQTNTDSITLQAWVKAESLSGSIINKPGMYELKMQDGKPVFSVGNNNVESGTELELYTADNPSGFVHLTAVATADSATIYVNGQPIAGKKLTPNDSNGLVTGTNDEIVIGRGFTGNIDEVRIWGIALDSLTIARDYTRYLTGGETGLLAYYTFDYSVIDSFFDTSYKGADYNENHGKAYATLDDVNIPSPLQLGYKGYTAADGSYSIRAIPYAGNGTTYMIIPRLGIHKFESEKELRLLNANAQSHTVNFTDKSSFLVSGKVTYKGGTIPVEGVSFLIDGITSMDAKANIIVTDAKGQFSLNVPVGTHEVKATKANHRFANDGKITNSDGTDRNYQDLVTGIELTDITTVRYVGRVAGGSVEEAYPLGHSLSKNNLADSVKVELIYQNELYKLALQDSTAETTLQKPSYMQGTFGSHTKYSQNKVTILPDPLTGEFAADVLPEKFRVNLIVPGHDESSIPGNSEVLDLTNAFTEENSIYEYIDSITIEGIYEKCSDTVRYNKSQQFIKRYTPTIRVTQLNATGEELPYFGEEKKEFQMVLAENNYTVPLYDKSKYTLGKPVFEQYKSYIFKTKVFEKYEYMNAEGTLKEDIDADEVPTTDAKVTFGDGLTGESQPELTVDKAGVVIDTMRVGNPDMTSGIRSVTATAVYGSESSSTSLNWEGGFDAIIVGGTSTGTNFVTKGPDDVMFVLRDPPGSHSYSYLEKGTSISRSSSYKGNVIQEGNETLGTLLGVKTLLYAGSPVAGTIEQTDFNNELQVGVTHSEEAGGSNTSIKSTTTTTRFQTSDDPLYVGAAGDLYVGYSTNILYGITNNVTIVSREKYIADGAEDAYKLIDAVTPPDSDWLLVTNTGLGIFQNYETLFAYPQIHIEQTLIPNLENIRNSILHAPNELTPTQAQALANQTKEQVYVSKLPRNHEHFGKSNIDPVFLNESSIMEFIEGASYKIYLPEPMQNDKSVNDTILILNQSIDNWKERMAENEEDKVNATLLQNYSFHAAAQVEYAEAFSYTFERNVNFKIAIGANIATKLGTNIRGQGFFMEINETLTQENSGEFVSTDVAEHCNGFVLAEDSGDDDYLSVDVCRVSGYRVLGQYKKYSNLHTNPDEQFTTFIFKTKAGSTSCPYEDEYRTKYYEPGKHVIDEATVQLEVPEIDVEKNFIENVPSGQPAYLKLFLRNNSEAKQDIWYVLKTVDESNPNGAKLSIDGSAIGNGRIFLVPSGETLVKTLEVSKGTVMNYDDLKLTLQSQCQCDPTNYQDNIADTVTFTVHFTPSCTDVNIKRPANNWTYNTKLPTKLVNGLIKHYMEVQLDGFDVNYDNFNRIKLQYKKASGSDEDWTTLMNYYTDQALYDQAVANGLNAEMINAEDAGTIKYQWILDDMQDQRYDLRAVGVCIINNVEVENISEVHSGIKDMYNPRLFGSAQPANGVLTINDDIKLNFNETIAEGYLTDNNFEVTGVRNGAQTDHSVSVRLDGANDFLSSEFERNWNGKDITVEMWVLADEPREATFFSQGNVNESMEFGITADNRLRVKIGTTEITSTDAVPYDQGTWAHVAFVYDKTGTVTAYYNFVEYISHASVGTYNGEGSYNFGCNVKGDSHFAGRMHNARIWDKVLTSGRIQTNSLTLLSGAESNLLAYYPMNEARGTTLLDKARGANLDMNGSEWSLPEGRAANFDGNTYIKLKTGSSAVVDYMMDYTIEFWFKAEPEQTDATLVANGRGDGQDMGGSRNLFSIGFEDGELTFRNNEVKAVANGDYLDNNWHHIAIAVSRTTGRGQILIDGVLNTYFESQDIGGISAEYMYLGARGWTLETDVDIIDNYFKGILDDFRIWNLYKNETLVANGNNERLDGTEKGLLAYYPFEHYINWQGTKELQFTLKDMKVQKDTSLGVPEAEAFGNDPETIASAPVKDKGPISKLLYDFVVNNDALIINLNETWDRIEKTIVTFTVDGVRDMNGNEILSPVTWSAYIDRNQLKWSENEVNIEKPVYEAEEFTVKAVNKGGSVQHFTIENAPAWLEVTPANGTIDPLASIDIKFAIDEGLNIGSYNEVIYMRNDNNVSEALPLTIRVKGEKPDWSVNPADFKYNMSVFGKMRFNNVYSTDKEDMLAVFVDGQCRGVANSEYDKTGDLWYAFLTVYSNTVLADNLEFRMWDASTGKIYSAMPDRRISFVNDLIIGVANEPVIFDGKEMFYQSIALTQGWNWISFNLASPNLANVTTALKNGSWGNGDIIKNQDYFDSYSANGNRWTGSLSNNGGINNTSLYMVKTTAAQTLSVSGNAIPAKETPITVKGNKWNYIGYLPGINFTVTEALAGYDAKEGDIVKSQNQFSMYSGTRWIGNLTYMEANKGYMLLRKDATDTSFIYPSTSGSLSNTSAKARTRSADAEPENYLNGDHAENMNIIAVGTGILPTDRILAYVNGELRGVGQNVTTATGDMQFITVAGSESGNAVTFSLERDGKIIARANNAVNYRSNTVQGTTDVPFVLDFSAVKGNVTFYPSPFTDKLNIHVTVGEDGDMQLDVYDVTGRILMKRTEKVHRGLHTTGWDGKNAQGTECETGIYLIHVTVDGKTTIIKIEKK